jgi:hypothetical protein
MQAKVFNGSVSTGGEPLDIHAVDVGAFRLLNSNVTQLAENIASSLTNTIRASRNPVTVGGDSLQMLPTVRVRWWFLSLPVLTVLTAVSFLASTGLTARPDEVLWKSSIMALISH